jgi:2,4-dienoyl-CoA reductase-like NADH-dependent reductase (Old Yellow Enzyme family)
MPLWLRISATEWMEYADKESWNIEDSIRLAKILPGLAIDVLDVSSGGNNNDQKIKVHTHYQSDLAGQIREAVRAEGLDLTIAAVGQVREADVAREIVQQNGDGRVGVELENGQVTRADLVLVARQFLRDPQFVLRVAEDLNVKVKGPNQYHRAAGKPRPRTKI